MMFTNQTTMVSYSKCLRLASLTFSKVATVHQVIGAPLNLLYDVSHSVVRYAITYGKLAILLSSMIIGCIFVV